MAAGFPAGPNAKLPQPQFEIWLITPAIHRIWREDPVVPDDAAEDVIRAGRLYHAIRGIGCAVDIIPWRKTDFEGRAAYVVASLPATVVREGRLLYDAQRVAA